MSNLLTIIYQLPLAEGEDEPRIHTVFLREPFSLDTLCEAVRRHMRWAPAVEMEFRALDSGAHGTILDTIEDMVTMRQVLNVPCLFVRVVEISQSQHVTPSASEPSRSSVSAGYPEAVAGLRRDFEKTKKEAQKAPSPFAAAAVDKVESSQKEFPIYDGRTVYRGRPDVIDTRGPPVEIFHEAFAVFRRESAQDDSLSPGDMRSVRNLMACLAARDRYEAKREPIFHEALTALCGEAIAKHPVPGSTQGGDGAAMVPFGSSSSTNVPTIHVEVKLEFGSGGNKDAAYQNASCARKWAVSEQMATVVTSTCAPCFLILGVGPTFQIWGFIWAGVMVLQPLTDCISVVNPECFMDETVTKIACIFRALRKSLCCLRTFYASATPSPEFLPRAHLPRHTTCILYDEHSRAYTIELQYTDALWPTQRWRPMWTAQIVEIKNLSQAQEAVTVGETVLVKFTQRYGRKAHSVLAPEFAPKLFSCTALEDGNGLYMVVMEFIKGRHAENLHNVKLSNRHYPAVEEAITKLHSAGFVFGDLRLPNIMIRDSDDRALLVDFDWSGENGDVAYPPGLVHQVEDQNILPGAPITFAHDKYRLEQLL